jgi:hypothetical protein
MTKTIQFKPQKRSASAEDWVHGGAKPADRGAPTAPVAGPIKRFTIDVPSVGMLLALPAIPLFFISVFSLYGPRS